KQRLVGHVEHRIVADSSACQQPRRDERVHYLLLRVRQRAASYPSTGWFVVPDRDEPQQGRQHEVATVDGPQFSGDLVRLAGQYTGNATKALIGIGGHDPCRACGTVELLQRVRQQRQRITRARFGGDELRQDLWLEDQSRTAGWLFDDFQQRRAVKG